MIVPPVGKSGPWTIAQRSSSLVLRIVDQRRDRIGDLVEIMRRNVRRHADGDAARAVDEQLRQTPRKHARLDALVVESRNERNRLFIDIGQDVERGARKPRFGIPIRRGRIGVDRAEVAVPVDERIAQRKILRHAHERVVNRAIAVRMVALEHLADDTGAFSMLLARDRAPSRASRKESGAEQA